MTWRCQERRWTGNLNSEGCELMVGVLDSGIASHGLLDGRIVAGGYDFVDADDDPADESGTGTHVAGIVADLTKSPDDLTNPLDQVKLLPERVLDASGYGYASLAAMALNTAANQGAKVVTLGFSGGHSRFLEEAAQAAADGGVIVVAAAGNDSSDDVLPCPADVGGVISVGAYDQNHNRASFSNWGSSIDLAAPGVGVESCALDGGYTSMNGTSAAAAHVAAVAAMLELGLPVWTPTDIERTLQAETFFIPYDEGWLLSHPKHAEYANDAFVGLSELAKDDPEAGYLDTPPPLEISYSELATQSVTKKRGEVFDKLSRSAEGCWLFTQLDESSQVKISETGEVTVIQGTDPGDYVIKLSITEIGGPTTRCSLKVTVTGEKPAVSSEGDFSEQSGSGSSAGSAVGGDEDSRQESEQNSGRGSDQDAGGSESGGGQAGGSESGGGQAGSGGISGAASSQPSSATRTRAASASPGAGRAASQGSETGSSAQSENAQQGSPLPKTGDAVPLRAMELFLTMAVVSLGVLKQGGWAARGMEAKR